MSVTYDWSPLLQAISGVAQKRQFDNQLSELFGQVNIPGTAAQNQSVTMPSAPMQASAAPAQVAGNAITARVPGGYHPMIGGGDLNAGGSSPLNVSIPGTAPQTDYTGPIGQSLGNDQSSTLLPLLRMMGPAGMPLLLQSVQAAQAHKQDMADRKVTPISDQEAGSLGLRPGGVYGRDATGNIVTVQASDMKSAGAMGQQQQDETFKNSLPATPYQQAQIADARAGQDETARHNQAVEAQGDTPPDPTTIKYWAQSVAAGGPMPTLGMGKQAAAYRQAILKEVATINGGKGMTGADQNAATGTTKANMTSLAKITPLRAATEAYEGTMLQNMGLAQQLMAKGAGTTGIPVLNRWQNYAKGKYAGDPDVAAFQTAIQTVKNEYAKIQSGSIGNAPVTDSARREAEAMLDPSQTPEQIMANFNYMKAETANRTRALRGQEDALRGGLSGKNDTPALDMQNGGKGGGKADPLGIR